MRHLKTPSLVVATALALAMQVGPAAARVAHICPELGKGGRGQLSVRISSGCMTGMARYQGNDLKLVVDQDTATIRVTGNIRFEPLGNRAVSADCAGAKSFTLTAANADPRRYSVFYNGAHIGVADLKGVTDGRQCLSPRTARSDPGRVMRPGKYTWTKIPAAGWSGDSPFGALEPLLREHPESTEGRPTVSISVERARWHRMTALSGNDRDPFLVAKIERHGLVDDAVEGDRYFAAVRQTGGTWKVIGLWRQQMCRRGKTAGQWSNKPCA